MQLVRSSDLSHLAGCLCRLLEEPGPALLEPEIILIQSAGMERWLSRELAQRRGVAANLHFPFPRAFIHQVLDEVLGADPAVARYERRALVWELFSLLGQASDDPAFAFVARNLAHDSDGSQRFRLARELTDLFDQYLTYRPQMMLRWAAGKGATKRDQQEPGGNGRGADGASPLDFQAEIFRRVVARLGPFHLAERLRRFLREVEPSQLRKSLPSRLTLVGGAGLPPVYLRVLSRIAEVIPVTVLSFQVCGEYFADLHPTEEALPELGEGAHPLLVSLGKVGADFQQLLEMSGNYTELGAAFPRRNPGTLLSELQNDILSGNQRPSTELLPAALLADGSISVDVCHSPLREVEILADRLLSWFKQDPTLAPEDVVVLSPDIEAYSPLISAVFAARGEHGPKLPFRIFDRSEGAINPVAKVLLVGLPLLTGRFKLSALLDFLQLEPVQARFELSPVDLERVADWLRKVGVRWGADAEHVQSFGITSDGAHTLTWGLRRLLLGYACADEGDLLCQGLVPEDDVPAGDGELLGRFAEFTRQLLGFRDEVLRGPRPPSEWFDLILAFLDAFVAQGTGANWESQSVRQVVFGLRQHADWAEVSESIGLAPLSRLLAGELEVQRSSADFLSGGVTFCALLPLRTIPFRKICVLGLDQDRFPRADEPSNLSWLLHEPRIGDRSLRADDRFLFLELLVAASETLALSYVGRSVQDNTECPASVVVFELLSVLTNMVESEAAGQVPKFPLRIHPLQPFSPRYFVAGGELTSFSTSAFEGARALVAQGTGAPREISRFLDEPVQPFGGKSELQVSMGEFLRFYKNPARAYLATLGVHLDDEIEQFEDREPVGADPLSRFGLGDSLVRQLARHEPLLERVHLARGQLPPASAGRLVLAEISAHAERVLEAARPFLGSGEREAVELAIPLAGKLSDGRLVSGVLGGQLELLAQTHLQMGYGEPTPKRKLSLWIEHLALCASGYEARSVLIGRAPSNAAQVNAWLAPPVAKSWAQARLGELFQDYLLGHEMPLLFFPDASEALAERHAKLGLGEFGERPEDDHEALAAAHKKVGRQGNLPGELLQLYRGVTPVLGLSLEDQASFYNLSLRVFRPLLEQLTRLDLSGENPS